MPSIFHHTYNEIISLDNLLLAWTEFARGKKSKTDIQLFSLRLMDNILALHEDLKNQTYQHGAYEDFYVNDPKRRHIHKASVRDRLLHHAVYRLLYPFFDKTFFPDSYSCRKDKGMHKALNKFRAMAYKVSSNHTRASWVLKGDIKKFFASLNHQVLLNILKDHIADKDIIFLLQNIITSYHNENEPGVGLPLGNLTSQLFANVYMNVFDQFIKHGLKIKYYIRYADDFVILSVDKCYLAGLVPKIEQFLSGKLKLALHPDKIFLKTIASGVDFLGWTHFTDHRVLRTKTKRRMFQRTQSNPSIETLQSYLGMLRWGNGFKLEGDLLDTFWLLRSS